VGWRLKGEEVRGLQDLDTIIRELKSLREDFDRAFNAFSRRLNALGD
jgi:hypothetical protein